MKASTFLKPLSLIPALLLMYMIYSFSAQTGDQSASLSLQVSRKIVTVYDKAARAGMGEWEVEQKAESLNKYVRKAAHITEYFLLAVAVSFPLYVYGVRGIALVFAAGLICVGYACGDEYHQSMVNGRGPSARDVGIDSIGILAGILLVRIMGWSARAAVTGPRIEREQRRREEELDSWEEELRRREEAIRRRERYDALQRRRAETEEDALKKEVRREGQHDPDGRTKIYPAGRPEENERGMTRVYRPVQTAEKKENPGGSRAVSGRYAYQRGSGEATGRNAYRSSTETAVRDEYQHSSAEAAGREAYRSDSKEAERKREEEMRRQACLKRQRQEEMRRQQEEKARRLEQERRRAVRQRNEEEADEDTSDLLSEDMPLFLRRKKK